MATNRDGTANVLAAAQEQAARRFVLVPRRGRRADCPGPADRRKPDPHPGHRLRPFQARGRSAGPSRIRCRGPSFARRWCMANGTVRRSGSSGSRAGWALVFGDGSQELSVIYAEDLARRSSRRPSARRRRAACTLRPIPPRRRAWTWYAPVPGRSGLRPEVCPSRRASAASSCGPLARWRMSPDALPSSRPTRRRSIWRPPGPAAGTP